MMQTFGFETPGRKFSARDLFLLQAVQGAIPPEFPVTGTLPCGLPRCQEKRGTLIFRCESSRFEGEFVTESLKNTLSEQFGVTLQLVRDRKGDYFEFRSLHADRVADEGAGVLLGAIVTTIRMAGDNPESVEDLPPMSSPELFRRRMAEPFEKILERDEPELWSALMIGGAPQVSELRGKVSALVPITRRARDDSEITQKLAELGVNAKFATVRGRRCVLLEAPYTAESRVLVIVSLIELMRVFTKSPG